MNELTLIRNKDLEAAYHKALCKSWTNDMVVSKFIERVVNDGAPRFYITERKLLSIISKMRKGIPIGRNPEKIRMYNDLYAIYCEKERVMCSHRKIDIAAAAIYSPAPSFYIKPQQAGYILYGRYGH